MDNDVNRIFNMLMKKDKCLGLLLDKLKLHNWTMYRHSMNVGTDMIRFYSDQWHSLTEAVTEIMIAGFLLDIGYMDIPNSIIDKPDTLTFDEYRIIKSHVDTGEKIVREYGYSERIQEYIRYHHEDTKGHGYLGKKICKSADMEPIIYLYIADKINALTERRDYKAAAGIKVYSKAAAIAHMIHQNEGLPEELSIAEQITTYSNRIMYN